jgi:integrase
VLEKAGIEPYAKICTATIEAGRDRRAHTPHQARHFLDAMRGLFRWAYKARFVKVDPTAGVKNLPRKRSDGFIPWTEEHATAYEARWPIGTRQRVWLDVLLYTGLRRGDAVRAGRQHARAGSIRTEKSGFMVEVPVIILPVLQATLDAGPTGDLTFIVGANGRPFTKESFGNEFRAACQEAAVPGSAHGVRKLAATRMANNGATEAQLMAVFGWTDPKMAAHYTRTADRKRLAAQSIEKLNASGTSMPAPSPPVRESEQKAQ